MSSTSSDLRSRVITIQPYFERRNFYEFTHTRRRFVIVDKALEKGRELKFAPLTVVVLDAGDIRRRSNAKTGQASFVRRLPQERPGASSGWDSAAGILPSVRPRCLPSSPLCPRCRAVEWFPYPAARSSDPLQEKFWGPWGSPVTRRIMTRPVPSMALRRPV